MLEPCNLLWITQRERLQNLWYKNTPGQMLEISRMDKPAGFSGRAVVRLIQEELGRFGSFWQGFPREIG